MASNVFLLFLTAASTACALHSPSMVAGPFRGQVDDADRRIARRDVTYPEYFLQVPVDHFHNESKYEPHSNGTFGLRYWFDARYYEPGGPVFVLSAGETSGEDRFPFMEKGIIKEVTEATGGLGVILEHRYYGTSYPTPDFSTESLRFLTTEQALADTAYFAQHVVFPGLEGVDLGPSTTPWIAYGGSYAGAFVAFLRKIYPDVFFAAISSSGVPEAIWDYWQYFEAAITYGPPVCVETTRKLTNVVDNILLNETLAEHVEPLKEAFALQGVTDNAVFAYTITRGIGLLQSYNWDPEVGSRGFFQYCDTISDNENQYPKLEDRRTAVEELITVGGYKDDMDVLTDRMLNYIGYLGYVGVDACAEDQDTCSDAADAESYASDDLSQTWRLWNYQVCTEWGYLQTGNTPADVLPVISRLINVEYLSRSCIEAFNLTQPANVSNINRYGGHAISYPRLAWLDGEWDPWRAAGVQALGLQPRVSTPSEPVILIAEAVHHWDEGGVFKNETRPGVPPMAVKHAKDEIRSFVKEWLKDWKSPV